MLIPKVNTVRRYSMKTIKTATIVIFASLAVSACSDSDSTPPEAAALVESAPKTQEKTVNYQELVDNDTKIFRSYFNQKFPSVEVSEFKNGVYAIDAASREQWLDIEEFPPYELAIDDGQELYEESFANGKSYASCFENEGMSIRQNYPYFDTETNQVITLELAINQCREANGEEPLEYGTGDIASISASNSSYWTYRYYWMCSY